MEEFQISDLGEVLAHAWFLEDWRYWKLICIYVSYKTT